MFCLPQVSGLCHNRPPKPGNAWMPGQDLTNLGASLPANPCCRFSAERPPVHQELSSVLTDTVLIRLFAVTVKMIVETAATNLIALQIAAIMPQAAEMSSKVPTTLGSMNLLQIVPGPWRDLMDITFCSRSVHNNRGVNRDLISCTYTYFHFHFHFQIEDN